MDPGTMAALISAAANIGGSILGNPGNQETKMQRTQRKLVDKLISSLSGKGEFADLYSTDEASFNRGIRDPMMNAFRNQTAPQIQQEYIASGQQRGTGLDDQLLRAGVDMDSLINRHLMEYQQGALNRKQNTISSILGGGMGAPNPISTGQAAAQGLGGYLHSDSFNNLITDYSKSFKDKSRDDGQRSGFIPNTQPYKRNMPEFQYSLR